MSGQTLIGNRAGQFPINKPVGQQVSPQKAGAGPAAASIVIPPPAPLIVNGRSVIIDVRTMSGTDIVNLLNTIPGIAASIDVSGALVVTGINSIDGDANLRAMLGI